MTTVEEKKKQRLQFLNLVYDRSDGNPFQWVNMHDIGKELGWDDQITETTAQYLVAEGLIEFKTFGGTLGITLNGAKEIERARSRPDKATTYFPPMVNILSGDFRNSILNIDSTLTSLTQTINALPSDTEEVKKLVKQLDEELQKVPQEKTEEAAAVASATEALIKSAGEKNPNRTWVKISKEGLIQAAKNLAEVTPTVLTIANQIVLEIGRITKT